MFIIARIPLLQLYQPLASRLSLHDCLTKALERGELWVSGSRAYTSFRSDWIADDDWSAAREAFLNQYPHLTDAEGFLEQAKVTLDTHTAAANRVWPDLQDEVWIKDGTVHLARLEARELPLALPVFRSA